jgi:hypothetical protein
MDSGEMKVLLIFLSFIHKSTDKHSRYEAPREETREAYGCLAIDNAKDNVVALSVYV